MSGHPFEFEQAARLDSADRRARQPAGPLVELVASFDPRRILDVGVGTGYVALPLAAALPRAEVVGLDIEPRIMALARERAQQAGLLARLQLLETPPARLSVEDGGFDVVLLVNLYHELPDRPGSLREIQRVLRPGGRVVICDWGPVEGEAPAGPPGAHRVAPQVAEVELREAGFVQLEGRELYPDFYTLLAARPGA